MAEGPSARPASSPIGTIVVIAKAPEPGRSKTRLVPPLTPDQACDVSWACLLDTVDVVAATCAARRVLAVDGDLGDCRPTGFELLRQRGDGLGERLAAVFEDVPGPTVVVAMDTPQMTVDLLREALASLSHSCDAVLGPAVDGGYWLVGLRAGVDPRPVFAGVPMSRPETGAAQRTRLEALGLCIAELPMLRDLDTFEDLGKIAELVPERRIGRLGVQLSFAHR